MKEIIKILVFGTLIVAVFILWARSFSYLMNQVELDFAHKVAREMRKDECLKISKLCDEKPTKECYENFILCVDSLKE